MKLLQQQDKDNLGKIESSVATNATADLATAATQSNTNIHWLYQQCQQGKVNMMTDVLPLGMSLVVFQYLCKIEIDIPESTDRNDDLIIQMTMQTISLMHSMIPVCSREEMLKIQLD